MICSRHYNSPENKKIRSERARNGATEKWRRYHESLADEPVREDPPDDMFRLTFDNLITGKTDVLLFHPGTRKNNYRIDVNGKPWRVCGFSDVLDRIGKSCYKISVSG